MAQTSWFLYQALRAGYLLNTAATQPKDEALLKRIVADAQSLHDQTLDDTDWLLEQLAREFAVIGELDGKRKFPIGGSSRAAKEASRMVQQLQAALTRTRGEAARDHYEQLGAPGIRAFRADKVPSRFLRILGLRLDRDEHVAGIADASCDLWIRDLHSAGWAVVTDRRVLILKQDSFLRLADIALSFPLDDLRYVRTRDRGDRGPRLIW